MHIDTLKKHASSLLNVANNKSVKSLQGETKDLRSQAFKCNLEIEGVLFVLHCK